MLPKVAVSACLMGISCRYDGDDNLNRDLLEKLDGYNIIPFCPEAYCFGTPRPTMDLVNSEEGVEAISNMTFSNLSQPIREYGELFFQEHSDIELFIGKDRSPSCAVCSGKVYDREKNLLHKKGTGLMAQVALDLNIEAWDSEDFMRTS